MHNIMFIPITDCPYHVGDTVECEHTKERARVTRVEFDTVHCIMASGQVFYRTWTHNFDPVFKTSGCGLKQVGG